MIKTLTPQELSLKLQNKSVLLIDVREPEEFQQGFIEGSALVPLSLFDPKEFISLNKPCIFYCRSGARSAHACQEVLNLNPQAQVFNLEGGILAWLKEGFSIHD